MTVDGFILTSYSINIDLYLWLSFPSSPPLGAASLNVTQSSQTKFSQPSALQLHWVQFPTSTNETESRRDAEAALPPTQRATVQHPINVAVHWEVPARVLLSHLVSLEWRDLRPVVGLSLQWRHHLNVRPRDRAINYLCGREQYLINGVGVNTCLINCMGVHAEFLDWHINAWIVYVHVNGW